MVEGPGCTLNGEKIRARVSRGQRVQEIRGSLVTHTTQPGKSPFCSLHGAQFSGVETLGKELFMYFGQKALRVHFGMSGSMRINPSVQKESDQAPVLQVCLSNDTVCFFHSSVEIRGTEECEQKVLSSSHLDVCSPLFSQPRSEEAVKAQRSRMLCDVLLDQAVMPGVGNIIKNEALFDSGLHPGVKVQQLTDKQTHHLVRMTRDFTLLFYKCRRSGSPLHTHYKVYKRSQCGQCSHVITACRLGDHGRMTYFCERCQSGDPHSLDVSFGIHAHKPVCLQQRLPGTGRITGYGALPVRNSLLGWVSREQPDDRVGKKHEEDWTCGVCTLINLPRAVACDACLTPRPRVFSESTSPESSPFTRDLIKYPCTKFKRPQEERKLNWRSAFGTSTLVFTNVGPSSSPNGKGLDPRPPNLCPGTTSPSYTYTDAAPGGDTHPAKKRRTNDGIPNSRLPSAVGFGSSAPPTGPVAPPTGPVAPPTGPVAPCCTVHGCAAVLRVVHKEGENKGRVFYSCSLPRDAQCSFFEWADLHFPFCLHGKRSLMRTVLKLGPNNGRSFYTCALMKGKQCDFFQWAPSC